MTGISNMIYGAEDWRYRCWDTDCASEDPTNSSIVTMTDVLATALVICETKSLLQLNY